MERIKQYILKKKYEKAQSIYLIFCWNKYGVLEAKWSGKFDKDGHPLTIYYTDCNGLKDLYYITEWYKESTGMSYGYSFNKTHAENIVKRLNNE